MECPHCLGAVRVRCPLCGGRRVVPLVACVEYELADLGFRYNWVDSAAAYVAICAIREASVEG